MDVVAVILALGLSLLVVLILIATMIQVVTSNRPIINLSENATQLLVASVGAFSGLLGGYLGYNLKHREKGGDDQEKQP